MVTENMIRRRDFYFVLGEAKYSWDLFLAARGSVFTLSSYEYLKSNSFYCCFTVNIDKFKAFGNKCTLY
jgi:hypothetical protein